MNRNECQKLIDSYVDWQDHAMPCPECMPITCAKVVRQPEVGL